MNNFIRKVVFPGLILLLCFRGTVTAESFDGKIIKIVVGGPAGEAYDQYARILAQYLPRYIPGNPNMIVQNMPGAGSMIAANYVYAVARPDGLTIASIFPGLYLDQLIKRTEVQFDWKRFSWIGSTARSNYLLYVRANTPFRTVEDIRKATERAKCGATGTTSPSYYLPRLFEEVLGTPFNLVTGYKGGGDIDLAVERGEVQCRAFTISTFFSREPFHTWRKTAFVRVVIQTGKKRDSRLSDVPTVYELMDHYKTPEAGKALASVILAGGDVGRPIVGPPGIKTEHLKILRQAFAKVMQDREFLEEAKKRKLELDPSSGEELESLAKEVVDQPAQVVERMRKLLEK